MVPCTGGISLKKKQGRLSFQSNVQGRKLAFFFSQKKTAPKLGCLITEHTIMKSKEKANKAEKRIKKWYD